MRGLQEEFSCVYTVKVKDWVFKLSKSQIERDSPNYFTSYFLDSGEQSTAHTLEISRDPRLFELVLRHLNGYQVVPINSGYIPSYPTPETALADLRADAEFYQLNGLLSLCSANENTTPTILRSKAEPTPRFAVIMGHFNTFPNNVVPSEDFNDFIPRFSISLLNNEHYSAASANMSTLSESTISRSHHFLIVANWSERIINAVVQRDTRSVDSWELLGWKRDIFEENVRHSTIFVRLWVGPGFEIKY